KLFAVGVDVEMTLPDESVPKSWSLPMLVAPVPPFDTPSVPVNESAVAAPSTVVDVHERLPEQLGVPVAIEYALLPHRPATKTCPPVSADEVPILLLKVSQSAAVRKPFRSPVAACPLV